MSEKDIPSLIALVERIRAKPPLSEEKRLLHGVWCAIQFDNVQEAKPLKPTPKEKLFERWKAVYQARAEGLSWPGAYEAASERLANTDFEGAASTMKDAYGKVQRIRRKATAGAANPA